jgi:hypothetical protein
MSTVRAHLAMLRTLARQDPATTMLTMAIVGAMEEMAEELERLSSAVDSLTDGNEPPGLGSV